MMANGTKGIAINAQDAMARLFASIELDWSLATL
jgi:hypothetical protein